MKLLLVCMFCSLLLSCKVIDYSGLTVLPPFKSINIVTNDDFKSVYESTLKYGGTDYTNATSTGGVSFSFLLNEHQNRRFNYVSRCIDMPNGLLIDLVGISGRINGCYPSQSNDYDISDYRLHRIYVHDSRMKRSFKRSSKHLIKSMFMDSHGSIRIDYGFEGIIHTGMPVNLAKGRLYQNGYSEDTLKNHDFITILEKIKVLRSELTYPSKTSLITDSYAWKVYKGNKIIFISLNTNSNYSGDSLLNNIIVTDYDQSNEYEFLEL